MRVQFRRSRLIRHLLEGILEIWPAALSSFADSQGFGLLRKRTVVFPIAVIKYLSRNTLQVRRFMGLALQGTKYGRGGRGCVFASREPRKQKSGNADVQLAFWGFPLHSGVVFVFQGSFVLSVNPLWKLPQGHMRGQAGLMP